MTDNMKRKPVVRPSTTMTGPRSWRGATPEQSQRRCFSPWNRWSRVRS